MDPWSELLGQSPAMEAVRDTVRRLLARQQPGRRPPAILLQGETGTGKGLLARLIHRLGPRARGEFVDVNCAAIPETLLESELFGYERGAFTDARKAKPGLFQTAHLGTIFLDEVGSLPEALQAKLLTVIEERAVRRLGGTRPEPADAWIISATNTNLLSGVRERRFREDLYHRLAVFTLRLPPLRERDGDVLMLAERYLARVCADYGLPAKTLAADARARLIAHPWKGNVRELFNVIERAALLAEDSIISGLHLELGAAPPSAEPGSGDAPAAVLARPLSLGDAMREHLLATLEQTDWNISRTAALLGISRNTLRARMDKLGLREGTAPAAAAKREPRAMPARPAPSPAPAFGPAASAAAAILTVRWEQRGIALMRVALATPEAVEALSDAGRALDTVIEKVQSFGGRVEALSPRGLEASFGAEPIEDAPRRAAHAGMAIQRAMDRSRGITPGPLPPRIAIHAAQAMVAYAGSLLQIDEDAKQQSASVLESLIAAAEPGHILASPAARALLERRFELAPLSGPADESARMFRLVGREGPGLGPAGRMAAFVGRRQEMAVLQSRLEAALRGQGQLVSIVGDAGIGKSRLLYEFRQSLGGDQVAYLEGRCLSYGTPIPYLPVLDLIRAVCRITEADDAEGSGEKIRHALELARMDPGKFAPYLLYLLGHKEGTEGVEAVAPETIKVVISETLRQLTLGASRHQPLLVVIEDLHWIDHASEDLLAAMVNGLPGAAVLFVVTYRPGYEPPWVNKSFATQLSLPPLSDEDSLRVAHSVLPGLSLPADLALEILSKAEGNPFFLEELALSIQDREGQASGRAVPDTVQGVLMSRIGRLAETEQSLLQSAAVIGKDVPLLILAAVAELPEEALGQALRHLSTAEFLYEMNSFPEVKYRFRHALTHEVAYESLRPARRRLLHARIVRAIETLHPDHPLEDIDRLAHHATRGELWEQAVVYSRRAGATAAARSAHPQAVAYLEQALEALRHLPETRDTIELAIDLRFELRNSLHPLGDPERILAHLREAEGFAKALDDPRRLARVFSFMTQYFRLMGDSDRAVESAAQALALAERLHDSPLWIVANTYLGSAYDARGEYAKAADTLKRSRVAARHVDPPGPGRRRPRAGLLAHLSGVLSRRARRVPGRGHLRAGRDPARRVRRPRVQPHLRLVRSRRPAPPPGGGRAGDRDDGARARPLPDLERADRLPAPRIVARRRLRSVRALERGDRPAGGRGERRRPDEENGGAFPASGPTRRGVPPRRPGRRRGQGGPPGPGAVAREEGARSSRLRASRRGGDRRAPGSAFPGRRPGRVRRGHRARRGARNAPPARALPPRPRPARASSRADRRGPAAPRGRSRSLPGSRHALLAAAKPGRIPLASLSPSWGAAPPVAPRRPGRRPGPAL